MASLLSVRDLAVTQYPNAALHNLQLDIGVGELVGLVGMNGSGKTTLLRALIGDILLTSGSIQWKGGEIGKLPSFRRAQLGMAYLPQDTPVFRTLTVRENLMVGANRATRDSVAASRLPGVLTDLADRKAEEISGGERRLTALESLIRSKPNLMLVDEPELGLPAVARERVIRHLATRARSISASALIVSHDVRSLEAVCDRVVRLKDGHLVPVSTRAPIPSSLGAALTPILSEPAQVPSSWRPSARKWWLRRPYPTRRFWELAVSHHLRWHFGLPLSVAIIAESALHFLHAGLGWHVAAAFLVPLLAYWLYIEHIHSEEFNAHLPLASWNRLAALLKDSDEYIGLSTVSVTRWLEPTAVALIALLGQRAARGGFRCVRYFMISSPEELSDLTAQSGPGFTAHCSAKAHLRLNLDARYIFRREATQLFEEDDSEPADFALFRTGGVPQVLVLFREAGHSVELEVYKGDTHATKVARFDKCAAELARITQDHTRTLESVFTVVL